LPYDMSLLIFYVAIYKIAFYIEENSISNKKSFIIGIFSFFGFLVYPGYFPLLVVCLFILFCNNLSKQNIFTKMRYANYYILGASLCLFIFEKIGQFAGRSYILDAKGLSKTITQGSFEESFAFIIKYLFEVEGVTGIILLISLPIFFIIILYKIKSKTFEQDSLISLVGIALLTTYLSYAFAGYFLHKVVYYGRLLHQYLPFLCIFAIFTINQLLIRITKKEKIILYAISIIFIVNFGFNFLKINSYAYPRDIMWQLIKTNNSINFDNVENSFNIDDRWPVMPKEKEAEYCDIFGKPIRSYYNIIEVGDHFNGSIYIVDNLSKNKIFNPNHNYRLLASKPSFMNFKAYQYDTGANMDDRLNMDKRNIQIKIFAAVKLKMAASAKRKPGFNHMDMVAK
jgi:hypothetical protein